MEDRELRDAYCQYLLSSSANYTLTHMADHIDGLSHDVINRYLKQERITAGDLWRQVKAEVVVSDRGYVVFDDTVLDKDFSTKIELVRWQYSGNAHAVIRGIGVVNCVYVNPEVERFWVIDYRIYEPDHDGKGKLDHVLDMVRNLIHHKKLPFSTVLMDSWYATTSVFKAIDEAGKRYYAPLKSNRQVNDAPDEKRTYERLESLRWTERDLQEGKVIKLKGTPGALRLKLFRIPVSSHRTEWVVTNDLSQNNVDATHTHCRVRWKIEQFHREAKQLTGLERCQCRKQRIQRNHIACAFLVWTRLKQIAETLGTTVYQLKQGLLSDWLKRDLASPAIAFSG